MSVPTFTFALSLDSTDVDLDVLLAGALSPTRVNVLPLVVVTDGPVAEAERPERLRLRHFFPNVAHDVVQLSHPLISDQLS